MKMFNMVLWIYLEVWIWLVIGMCQGPEFVTDTQGSEYAWVCSWIMLDFEHDRVLNLAGIFNKT